MSKGLGMLGLVVGAVLGATARYGIGLWATSRLGAALPFGTLLINVAGSFILGTWLALGGEWLGRHPALHLMIATGFCGSFTTFSTFSYEVVGLMWNGRQLAALLYAAGSLTLGIAGVLIGAAVGRALFVR